jgi:YVTN family beta-propeller protein
MSGPRGAPRRQSVGRAVRRAWLGALGLLTALLTAACAAPWPAGVPVPTLTPAASPTETSSGAVTPRPSLTSTPQPFVPASMAIEAFGGVCRAPEGMATLGDQVWVACAASANVCALGGDSVASCIATGGRPSALAADEAARRLYALDEGAEVIHVIADGTVLAAWSAPGATSLALLGGRLWVGTGDGGIAMYGAVDGAPLGRVPLTGGDAVLALAGSPGGERLFATTYGTLHAVDVPSLTDVAQVERNGIYRTLAVSADGTVVYTSEFDRAELRSYLLAISAESLEVVQRTPAPADPAAAIVDGRDGRLYLASGAAGWLSIYDRDLALLGALEVGLSPRGLALHAATGRLYVASADSDNVQVIDVAAQRVAATIALAGRYAGLAVDPATHMLYVAASSADAILAVSADGTVSRWALPGYPQAVLPLSGENRVAAMTRHPARLWILSEQGQALASYPVAPGSGGLYYDRSAGALYAGSLRLDLASGRVEVVAAKTWTEALQPPRGYVYDARRGCLYALAHNGIPGSNGGIVLAALAGCQAAPTFDALGVRDAAYDPATDRLFVASARVFGCRLQALRAEDGEEVANRALPEGCPAHLAVLPGSGHLWVAVETLGSSDHGTPAARLLCLDAATLAPLVEFPTDGPIDSLTADLQGQRVLAGIGTQGRLLAVTDGAP